MGRRCQEIPTRSLQRAGEVLKPIGRNRPAIKSGGALARESDEDALGIGNGVGTISG